MAGEDKTQVEEQQPDTVTEAVDAVAADETVEPVTAEAGADVDTLQLQLAQAQDQIAELKEQELRTQAEMQNVRRRAEMDVEKAHKFALDKFANELLPVVDSLERAIEASSSDDEAVVALREGVEMTLNMFVTGLGKFKVEQHNPVGEAFSPELHQAMSMVPNPDVPANHVMAVMQKGYSLNGRLIRPAMVIVSKGAE
ncbi:nucleotide exchange factor GrpE [Amphritea sp. 1_MG-2023]|uniref:nucleotide exchange factor GrpE n=1 Tax=Amphritea sp. 1_MG-2023 TaxID=3062670 RepID=UPI0026E11FFA|nr:nucleotide exchange factor GrpE [Amphritea sp. 1_MG-2023]MDO6563229.1 nucleotide exchange factor GrpE [Amphritea sp. 1_MG-2023]